jgi:two-component system, response regulator YesN
MYKLVLVDDEAEIRNGLSQYFPWHQTGFTVAGAFDNGQAALDYMASHPVDALLCDVSMPGMSGLDVARSLYEAGSSVKVLLLSGHKDFEYAKRAMAYDVRSYIVKPTDYEELHDEFLKLKTELDRASVERTAGQTTLEEASYQEKIIAVIRQYVEGSYADATLEQAARLVRMNPDYVSKYFKQQTGHNFTEYVVDVRMAQAARLLKDIRYKTFEVSEMVGYKYPKNFTRTFRQYYGVSPREFRSGCRPGETAESEPGSTCGSGPA